MESLDDGLAAEQALIGALFGRDGRRDPHALLRSVSLPGCRHATANAMLRDPRLVPPPVASTAPLFRMFSRWLISLGGARHRRVRRRIGGLFTPRRVEGFRALVRDRAAAVLDRLEAAGQMDLVTEFARPLPFSVIVEILGVPPDRHEFLGARLLTMGQGFANQRDPAFLERANAAVTELLGYFGGLLDERAQDPREDLLSILAADIPDDEHGRDDLVANCIFFVEAGHATTTSLISVGTLLLLQNPAELDALRAEPALLPGAIEEMLRLASPVARPPTRSRGARGRRLPLRPRFDAIRVPRGREPRPGGVPGSGPVRCPARAGAAARLRRRTALLPRRTARPTAWGGGDRQLAPPPSRAEPGRRAGLAGIDPASRTRAASGRVA